MWYWDACSVVARPTPYANKFLVIQVTCRTAIRLIKALSTNGGVPQFFRDLILKWLLISREAERVIEVHCTRRESESSTDSSMDSGTVAPSSSSDDSDNSDSDS